MKQLEIAALLTGRGNNTLPDKNVLNLLGKPLLSWPALAVKASSQVSRFFVSSEDDKILDAAATCGYEKIRRPQALAEPDSQHVDTILHGLDWMRDNHDYQPDILIVLLANSPTVKTQWIDDSIDIISADPTVSSVVPVYQDQEHNPYRCAQLDDDGCLKSFIDTPGQDISTNRQDLPNSYFLCHNYWTLNVGKSVKGSVANSLPWAFLGDRVKPIVVDQCFDIHTLDDLHEGEKWLRQELNINADSSC